MHLSFIMAKALWEKISNFSWRAFSSLPKLQQRREKPAWPVSRLELLKQGQKCVSQSINVERNVMSINSALRYISLISATASYQDTITSARIQTTWSASAHFQHKMPLLEGWPRWHPEWEGWAPFPSNTCPGQVVVSRIYPWRWRRRTHGRMGEGFQEYHTWFSTPSLEGEPNAH